MGKNNKGLNEYILFAKKTGDITTGEISDGHHTFNELYKQRAILFCTVCNLYPDIAWKSRKHYNEESDPMYEGDFIAGIYTPLGQAAFHLKNNYWDMLHVGELERAPKYDGYSSDEALARIASLGDLVGEIKEKDRREK